MTERGAKITGRCCLLALGLVLAGGPTLAQVGAPQTNPGAINQQNLRNQRQLEQQTAPTSPTQLVIPPQKPGASSLAPGGPTVMLRQVTFDSSAFLAPQALQAVAAPYVGKSVDLAQIQKIVAAVNALYAKRGVITGYAFLPPQDVKDGLVHIALVEGKVGRVEVEGERRLRPDYLRWRIGQPTGEVVQAGELANRLAVFNRTGVAQVQAALQAGQGFGLTDVELRVIEPKANTVDLFVDNQGVDSVGRNEGGFLWQTYGPLGFDDRATLYGVFSDGNASVNGSYSIPFDHSGGRIGLSGSYGAIRVIQGPYEKLDIRGSSATAAVNVSQPLYVDQHWLVLANASGSYLQSISKQAAVEVTNDETGKGSIGMTVGYTAPALSLNLQATGSRARTDAAVIKTEQTFDLVNGFGSALFHLPDRLDLLLAGAFQYSDAPLIPGDQLFQVGGPTSVRGYSANAVAGSSGFYMNLELHQGLLFGVPGLNGFLFYDRGSVYNPHPATTTLNSVGAGLSFPLFKRLQADVTAGFPITTAYPGQPSAEIYFRITARI